MSSKITIIVNFEDSDELKQVLDNIIQDYKNGKREKRGIFVEWQSKEIDGEIAEMVKKGVKYEERDGEWYMIIPSKINFI